MVPTLRSTSVRYDGEVEEVYQMASGKVYGRRGRNLSGKTGSIGTWLIRLPMTRSGEFTGEDED